MHDTMEALNGAGLAAPQIGVSQQVVIFGVRTQSALSAGRGSALHRADQSALEPVARRDGRRLGRLPVGAGHARPRAALHAAALSRLRPARQADRPHRERLPRTRRAARSRSSATASCTRCASATCATSVSTRRCFRARTCRTTRPMHRSEFDCHGCRHLRSSISLRDMSLFREQAFVGGRWEERRRRPGETGLQSGDRAAASARCRTSARPRRGARSKRPTRRCPTGARAPRRNARRSCASGST